MGLRDNLSRSYSKTLSAVAAEALTVLRVRIEFALGSSVTAHSLLLGAARGMAERDPCRTAAVLLEAARAAWNANDASRRDRSGRPIDSLVSWWRLRG